MDRVPGFEPVGWGSNPSMSTFHSFLPMPTPRRQFGDAGERIAEAFLLQKRYVLVERNFLVRQGEIDLVMESPEKTLVFVEVKTKALQHLVSRRKVLLLRKRNDLLQRCIYIFKNMSVKSVIFVSILFLSFFPGPTVEHIPNIVEGMM